MKNFFTLCFTLFTLSSAFAQIVVWDEDFETDGNTLNGGTRYTAANEFVDSDDDYFGRIAGATGIYQSICSSQVIGVIGTGSSGNQNGAYTGYHGEHYFAGEDLDDVVDGGCGTSGGTPVKNILVQNIHIGGATNIFFKGLFGAGSTNPCGGNQYDDEDYMKVFYDVDEVGRVEALCFFADMECQGDLSNEPLHMDPNCDRDGGEGPVLGNALQEFSFGIPTGTVLDLTIEISMNTGSEEVAVDWFRLESDTPLSTLGVEIVDLKAKKQEDGTVLLWETTSEKDNAYFEVERSSDGVGFEVIAKVAGAGNSRKPLSYNYIDKQLLNVNRIYYRLNQVDILGGSARSKIVVIENSIIEKELRVYPNPVKDLLYIVADAPGELEVSIFNLEGENVQQYKQHSEMGLLELDTTTLPQGSYMLRVKSKDSISTKRFIKM